MTRTTRTNLSMRSTRMKFAFAASARVDSVIEITNKKAVKQIPRPISAEDEAHLETH